ncbi:Uncharacterised protein [Vibrio cholerae]|nr:Uncharacterised protein [Vibrio cholerae]
MAPASKLFSTNSLTTEAGLSTTSPAAIWLAKRAGRIRIVMSAYLFGIISCCPTNNWSVRSWLAWRMLSTLTLY